MTSIKTIFILVQFSPILRKRKKKHAKRKLTQNSNKNRKKHRWHPCAQAKRPKKKATALVTLFTKMIEGGSGG